MTHNPNYDPAKDSQGALAFKVARVLETHTYGVATRTCTECRQEWPCQTVEILTKEM